MPPKKVSKAGPAKKLSKRTTQRTSDDDGDDYRDDGHEVQDQDNDDQQDPSQAEGKSAPKQSRAGRKPKPTEEKMKEQKVRAERLKNERASKSRAAAYIEKNAPDFWTKRETTAGLRNTDVGHLIDCFLNWAGANFPTSNTQGAAQQPVDHADAVDDAIADAGAAVDVGAANDATGVNDVEVEDQHAHDPNAEGEEEALGKAEGKKADPNWTYSLGDNLDEDSSSGSSIRAAPIAMPPPPTPPRLPDVVFTPTTVRGSFVSHNYLPIRGTQEEGPTHTAPARDFQYDRQPLLRWINQSHYRLQQKAADAYKAVDGVWRDRHKKIFNKVANTLIDACEELDTAHLEEGPEQEEEDAARDSDGLDGSDTAEEVGPFTGDATQVASEDIADDPNDSESGDEDGEMPDM